MSFNNQDRQKDWEGRKHVILRFAQDLLALKFVLHGVLNGCKHVILSEAKDLAAWRIRSFAQDDIANLGR